MWKSSVNYTHSSPCSCLCIQPKIVEALLGYELVQVSCGASHVLAVTNEREVFSWGRGDNGKWATSLVTWILCFFVFLFVLLQTAAAAPPGRPDILCSIVLVLSLRHAHSVLCLCLTGRLGLATLDCHNSPQQVSLPADFEAQRVLCGVDCSMIMSTQHQILASGNNRYSICLLTGHYVQQYEKYHITLIKTYDITLGSMYMINYIIRINKKKIF